MNNVTSNPYEVGFKKPPKHSQFKPGQSGNPKDRPKVNNDVPADLISSFEKVCGRKILITDGNRKRPVKQIEALFLRLFHNAINGNLKDAKLLFEIIEMIYGPCMKQAMPLTPPSYIIDFSGIPDESTPSI